MPQRDPMDGPIDSIPDDEIEPPIKKDLGFSQVVVVDNVPKVGPEKFDKLNSILNKIFSKLGNIRTFHLPRDEKNQTKGFAFVEYETEEAADNAIEKINGYTLDKNHVFKVNSFEDFKKYENVPDTYTPPEFGMHAHSENLRSWLLDERGVDQFALRYGDFTEVAWCKPKFGEEPETVVGRENWTESYVQWSPLGTYLATLHNRGVALFAGPNWNRAGRFAHPGVALIDFSPNEKYLITASQRIEDDNPKNPKGIIVWDVRSVVKLRGFLATPDMPWPAFKWSHDDQFLARLGKDCINIYETPSLNLVDKKPLVVENIKDFEWSPSDNIISYFVPEHNQKPASVVLVDIPSKKEIRQKNLFKVSDCKMYWHPSGDYLAVKVDRVNKTKKVTQTNFEFFRLREKMIPIEQLEIKDQIIQFAWEPKGHKFAIIHGESPRMEISFYTLEENKIKHLKTLEKKMANTLIWSPQGEFIVFAGIGPNSGSLLEFYNTADMETMGTHEHPMVSFIDWDPTGRYVTSVVSRWKHQIETGYKLFTFDGQLLQHVLKDRFYRLSWRPRPPSLLPESRQKEIKENIDEISKELKREDEEKIRKEIREKEQRREQLRKDFRQLEERLHQKYLDEAEERKKLRDGEPSDIEEDYEEVEEWVEEVQETRQIILE